MSKHRAKTTLIIITIVLSIVLLTAFWVMKLTSSMSGLSEETGSLRSSFEDVRIVSFIPLPQKYSPFAGSFSLTDQTTIYIAGKDSEEVDELYRVARYLATTLSRATGYLIGVLESVNPPKGHIVLTTIGEKAHLGSEGYELTVTEDEVVLNAVTPEGIFRGIQTIRQMLPPEIELDEIARNVVWDIPCANIKDWPTYPQRGMMLDVARHFFNVEEVKRVIDLIAQYKMNRFHLHLSDDQGWRIEIKSWPDLAKIGGLSSVRNERGGYFTQEDYTEIVNYALDRYITVIPEIDLPGHTNAALASYGILNPDGQRKQPYTAMLVGFSSLMTRDEITYEFLDDVLGELSALTPGEYIHIGGDEAHSTSKEDYDYFMGRVHTIIASYGKKTVGWGPFDTAPDTPSTSVLQRWNKESSKAEEKNMQIIVSHAQKAYIDMKYYEDSPVGLTWAGYINTKTAYEWDPTDYAPAENIIGVEAPLWSESIKTIDELEYLAFPRVIGHAEVGWTPQNMRDWEDYRQRLRSHFSRMENQGINFFKDPVIDND